MKRTAKPSNRRNERTFSNGAARGAKRRMLGRAVYLLGVVSLLSYVVAFPPWAGNSYYPAFDQPEIYQWNGTFGLRDSELNSPIWDPPHAHSPEIAATVRWPWQTAWSRAHIELSTFGIATRIAIGLVLLGLGLRVWNGISARNSRDKFVDLAWSVSLGTAISILGLILFGAFTAGYGLTDFIVVSGLSAGALFGLGYGAVTYRAERSRRSLFTVTELAWFAAGLFGSAVIMFLMGELALVFRGDPVGVTELGTSGFAGDQTLINVVTGIGIGISGIAASWVLAWSRMPRGLIVGVVVGCLLLGATYAFSF